ncbi:MAG: energy-coupling factor transporter ATPase [Erysipelotrichaceae bacterium]|nr:energy-coupling factor transporter ATPase [Erysipelotrichaceae bacterium]
MKAIETKDLVFSYDQENDVLKGVTFSVEKGSYTTLIGHNGSGKSTVAKLIAGLLEAKSGTIRVEGVEVNPENLPQLRDKIGIVFQNPDNQFIGSTVKDDIAFGLENHLVPTEEMDEIIEKYAKIVDMSGFLDREPEKLSGGQKQRVAIAGVLAMKPDVLIFDEATSMLDPRGKEEIKRVIRELHGQESLTILSITHDIEEAALADHVIVMNGGKVYLEGTPQEVFQHEKELKKIGLDIPFAEYVRSLFKERGIRLGSATVEGMVDELWQLRSAK